MMMDLRWVAGSVVLLVLARWAWQWSLDVLNRRHVLSHAAKVPDSFKEIMDEATYAKSVQYTLAQGRLHQWEISYDAVVLLIVLFSGVLPWALQRTSGWFGTSAWAAAGFLFGVGVLLSAVSLPLDWYHQFRLEERFGFNTTTPRTWWLDRLKALLLGMLLGYPLLVVVIKLVEWTGRSWWIWAWATMIGFQLLMLVLAPVLILPLFNRFTPLPDGSLRERLFNLAARTRFQARSIQIMDGRKRSRHSNAFFTGLGRFRQIVLFDTLVGQLAERELEAVLAHEIGHFKKKHIPKMVIYGAAGSFMGFFVLARLAEQEWFYRAFGFVPGNVAPALLLFGLLSGVLTLWLSPVAHWWSRRYEYEADGFAAQVMEEPGSLITALRKLNEKNLSNLVPWKSASR